MFGVACYFKHMEKRLRHCSILDEQDALPTLRSILVVDILHERNQPIVHVVDSNFKCTLISSVQMEVQKASHNLVDLQNAPSCSDIAICEFFKANRKMTPHSRAQCVVLCVLYWCARDILK